SRTRRRAPAGRYGRGGCGDACSPSSSSPPPEEGEGCPGEECRGGGRGAVEHLGQVLRGHHRVRGEAVDLRLVEQEEEGPGAADAVLGVVAVEPCLGHALLVERGTALLGTLTQLVEVPVLDGLG